MDTPAETVLESHEVRDTREHEDIIETTVWLTDNRIPDKYGFVCGSWKESEHDRSSEFYHQTRLLKLEDPINAVGFFWQREFPELLKLEMTCAVFRQEGMMTFPDNYRVKLPQLKCLTLDLSMPSISWVFPDDKEVALNALAGKNVTKILTLLHCPRLVALHFKTNEDKYRESNWEVEVFDFLKNKKHVKLVDLTLGNLLQRRDDKNPFVAGIYPLAPLQVLFIRYKASTHYQYYSTMMYNFWVPLLNHCNLVVVDFFDVPNILVHDLELLVRRNEATLQVVRYQFVFCGPQKRCKFYCEAFKNCHALRELKLDPGFCNEHAIRPLSRMLNFYLLPTTITSLSITNVNLSACIIPLLHKMENLEYLQLFQCGADAGRGISFHGLLQLYRLRKLNTLVAGPILLANKAEERKLTYIERALRKVYKEARYLRHQLHPRSPQRMFSLYWLPCYCQIF